MTKLTSINSCKCDKCNYTPKKNEYLIKVIDHIGNEHTLCGQCIEKANGRKKSITIGRLSSNISN